MRLKSIKLAGFKSFVDPTTVAFPTNLSAIVGPNGCGKSNVIDAVRWVMGESSAKNLRGESMTDVIFNGSGNRKPIGQASIELVFDNSEGKLVGEYASFTEISVKRRVTRDGQNQYFLNGTKCRRRDITDLFLGTGLGPRSYAIIEQGMISKLIESKPEELRVYIEEAAGISKYKERRRDTENRMRRTHENLERLTDIRDELDRQLQHLKRQAEAAEKYATFKQEERDLKAGLQALRWQKLNEEVIEMAKVISELELKIEAFVTDQLSIDTKIEKLRLQYTEESDKFNEVQGRYYSIGADIARLEQSIQHSTDRARQLSVDMADTQRALEEATEHLKSDQLRIEDWKAELAEIEPELELAQASDEQSAEILAEADEAMQAWQIKFDEFNQSSQGPRQEAEVQQSRLQHFEVSLRRLAERHEKARTERGEIANEDELDEIELLEEQLAENELEAESAQESVEMLQSDTEGARGQLRELSVKLDEVKTRKQQLEGRISSLEAMQEMALSAESGSADWIKAQGLADNPRLAAQLEVHEGWEQAVEAVLGEHLQAIQIDKLELLGESMQSLTEGSVSLVEAGCTPFSGSLAATLASKVSSPAQAHGLLQGIYVADSLTDALALRSKLDAGESVVTKDGIWLGASWLRIQRDQVSGAGVIERNRELEQAKVELDEMSERLQALVEQNEVHEQSIAENETKRVELQQQLTQKLRSKGEVQSSLSALKSKLEQVSLRRKQLDSELGELQEQLAVENEEQAEARALLAEAIERMEGDTSKREELLAQRDAIKARLDGIREQARQDRDGAHQLEMRHQSITTQLTSVQANLDRQMQQVERMTERKEMLQESMLEQDSPVDDLKLELEGKLEHRLAVEEQLNAARVGMQAIEHDLRESEQSRGRADHDLQHLRGQLEQRRLESQTVQVRRKTIEEQFAEGEYQLDEEVAKLPEGVQEKTWELELERIANRINRLGAINLAAIDEYRDASERKGYLDAQDADLVESLEALENAIRKIDKETRTRFRETFDYVNNGLQELFPKVFGGGHAYLELTGDDLLDTGIAIMARPPGKRNSTIHLLSGGEKALTAIALVFSIFRLNPAPFCMLDEVDAPLDDANVGRYARMVKEMSSQVQFIYITHNKIAMEMAQQLLGVTMQEAGVSRLVSVDVDEAAELAAS